MNNPPSTSELVSHHRIEAFVQRAGSAAGLPNKEAALLARLLTTNDLRGIFSHGSQRIGSYARLMRDGILNSKPNVEVIRETPVSLLMDGDGGLGYFPAYKGTVAIARKALDSGIAVLATRNHGHFGAAGIYARIPVEHDLLTFVTSGHQLGLRERMPLYFAAGASPMAFSVPAGDGPPLVVDFGCMHDLRPDDPHRDDIARLAPGLVLRSIGLGEICQTWGGFLTGLNLDLPSEEGSLGDGARPEQDGVIAGQGANQGALVICFRIDLFEESSIFKERVRDYIERIRSLAAIPPFTEAYPAGIVEAYREAEYRSSGVPVDLDHMSVLNALAREFDIEPV